MGIIVAFARKWTNFFLSRAHLKAEGIFEPKMPPQRRILKYNKNSDWLTPSKLRNFLIEDHLSDYINTISLKTEGGNIFTRFGQEFEEKVIEYLRKNSPFDIPSNLNFDETYEALNNTSNEPPRIIYQGTIASQRYKLFGHPDLIVRGDTLNHIFREMPINITINSNAYYIVEIKSKKMTFTTAGDGIRNTDTSIKYYKAQCYIYQKCLNEMLPPHRRHTNIAFILSRMPNGHLNCFQMPAVMSFGARLDSYIPRLVNETLNIKRSLIGKCERFPEEITDFDKVAEELYPNMSIPFDNSIKEEIAKELGDITLLFQCGRRQRQIAFEKGITSWRHPDCNGAVLGVANAFRRHVEDIININKNNTGAPLSSVSQPFGAEIRKNENVVDIYLDFEVGTDVLVENFETFPIANRVSIIYLIGLGKVEEQGVWKYQPFLARDLSSSERAEIQNFQQFVSYLGQIQKESNAQALRIFHWGHAELTWIKALKERSNVRINLNSFIFIDLCTLIKKHHFVVKGAFKYGLKEIAKAMKDNGMIETGWSLNDSVLSHWQALKDKNYEPILKYNEVDCKVMWEIVEYLRKNHM